MKAATIILTAALTLSINVLFAENTCSTVPTPASTESTIVKNLIPMTPVEATFEEMVPTVDFSNLAPVTPHEATFEEGMTLEVNSIMLVPVTPVEADFEDVNAEILANANLAPVTPMIADFE